jgi:hypothetical protein
MPELKSADHGFFSAPVTRKVRTPNRGMETVVVFDPEGPRTIGNSEIIRPSNSTISTF